MDLDPLRAITYAAHLAAAVALLAAARHAPSLRAASRVVALGLPLSVLVGAWTRDDGRALYHAAQAAQGAWLAAVLLAAGASPRAALALWGVFAVVALRWWPAPATPLYAAAQAVTVAVAVAALALEARRARAPLAGHLVALLLVVGEGCVGFAPYGLAVLRGTTVAEEWDAARVVRAVEWAALAVVGWRTWRSAQLWPSSGASSPWSPGEDGSPEPPLAHRGSWSPRSGGSGHGESEPGSGAPRGA